MIDRKEIIEEQRLRKIIRKLIEKAEIQKTQTEILEEEQLRGVIRKLILLEKIAVADDSPHEKTGINKLRKTLKKIVPQIRDDYLTLTTDPEQRKSYMAHLINGIDNLLAPIEANIDAPEPSAGLSEQDVDEQIDIEVGEEDDQFIDIGSDILPDDEAEEEVEIDDDEELVTRGLDGKENDETGRNEAIATFKQIQGTIVDDFGTLANDEDRELYHDYLKTNLLLWRDRFEEVLSTNLPEPTTPEYEQEKQQDTGASEEDALLEIINI